MNEFTEIVHDVIRNQRRAIVQGEAVNEENMNHNAFFESRKELEGIT